MAEYIPCPSCTEDITPDSDFCPHCGILLEPAGAVACDRHPGNEAFGVCIICRRVCCKECLAANRGRLFCTDHKKVRVEEDWAEVFRSTEIAEAELVKSVLEAAGHKVLVQNFNSIGFAWDGGGDSPVSRSNINKPAKVFVPIPEYLEAMKTKTEWNAVGGTDAAGDTETDPDDTREER